jgi:D-alanine-D-alanine ligase
VTSDRRLRVAVLMGGRSSEHEISIASARSVTGALDPARYEVTTIEIARDGQWALSVPVHELEQSKAEQRFEQSSTSLYKAAETLPVLDRRGVGTALAETDVVLPILHGPFGEDGTVQGLLELAGVPYVGPGVLASSVCMDKAVFKSVMRDNDIPVTRSVTILPGRPLEHPFAYPVFVKPANMGSSVGISKVRAPEELEAAVALAFRHDEKVLVEEFVSGTEVECSVLGNFDTPLASLPGEIVAHGFDAPDWYDYSAKYDEGGMDLIVPPRIAEEQILRVQDLSIRAFVASGCEGLARADCFVRDDGEVLVNELNTMPGFTATSVYAKLFEASGIPYAELLDRLIALALERHERRAKLVF